MPLRFYGHIKVYCRLPIKGQVAHCNHLPFCYLSSFCVLLCLSRCSTDNSPSRTSDDAADNSVLNNTCFRILCRVTLFQALCCSFSMLYSCGQLLIETFGVFTCLEHSHISTILSFSCPVIGQHSSSHSLLCFLSYVKTKRRNFLWHELSMDKT